MAPTPFSSTTWWTCSPRSRSPATSWQWCTAPRTCRTTRCSRSRREFNYSETTFPTPVDGGRYRTRIFTAGGELPFAGPPDSGHRLGAARARPADRRPGRPGVRRGRDRGPPRRRHGGARGRSRATWPARWTTRSPPRCSTRARTGRVRSRRRRWLAGTGLTFVYLPVRADAVARALPGRRGGPRDRGAAGTHRPARGHRPVRVRGAAPTRSRCTAASSWPDARMPRIRPPARPRPGSGLRCTPAARSATTAATGSARAARSAGRRCSSRAGATGRLTR